MVQRNSQQAGNGVFWRKLVGGRLANWRNAFLLLILSCLMVGCATPAKLQSMVVKEVSERKFSHDSPFRNSIYLQNVSGGGITLPFWLPNVDSPAFEGALRISLQAHGLLTNNKDTSNYHLESKLEDLTRPLVGTSLTVDSTIRYKLTEKGRDDPHMEKPITASYTGKWNDAFFFAIRLRLAVEGSVRENIEAFLRELASLKMR